MIDDMMLIRRQCGDNNTNTTTCMHLSHTTDIEDNKIFQINGNTIVLLH